MKYINYSELDDREFIRLLQKIKKNITINEDPFVNDYPSMIKRIDRILRKSTINLNGYEIKSLESSKLFIKSIDSLYKLEEVVDNKNKLNQKHLDKIRNNVYIYADNVSRVYTCIGKRLASIAEHINKVDSTNDMDIYLSITTYIDEFYNGYMNSENKTSYLKKLYKNNSMDANILENYSDILLDYYTKSIFNKKFIKVYEDYPIDKIHNIKKVISIYRMFLLSIDEFLNASKPVEDDIDFDMKKFIEEYNSYSRKEDFFSYLYVQYDITDTKLNTYINYFKVKYIEKFNNSYNEELNLLYKLDSIYEEYTKFLNDLIRPNLIDKDIIDSYLNNKDIDVMFFDLLTNDKLRKDRINNFYHGKLSEEERIKYAIILNYIDNRLVTVSSNEVFKDRIILSNIKNKKLYYDYMNDNFFKRKYKPTSKFVRFDKRGLNKEEIEKVDEYSNMYTEYYNSLVKENIRTNYVSTKEANQILELSEEELLDIVDKLMECDSKYVILEFYKLSPYSVPIFYNIVKKYLTLSKKVFMNKFYGIYKDDITIDDTRKQFILDVEVMKYYISDNNFYTVTLEDKTEVFRLLEEENTPITNRTFNSRLRKYYEENKETLLNKNTKSKVLTLR